MKHFFTISLCFLALSLSAQVDCSDIFISEYCEGTGNNKGVEFFNPTSESIDLSAYWLQRWSNGEAGMTDETQLFGTLPPLTTWVLVNGQTEDFDLGGGAISPACDPVMQGMADQLGDPYPAPMYMNGNDALVLVKNGITVVDIFGKPGENPGVAWTDDAENGFIDVGDGATWLTSNHTLRRKYEVVQGLNVPPVVFDTFLEWDTLPVNTWDGLGFHSCICGEFGCTIYIACNYDPEATIDDGSCEFICNGCTDTEACNYDSSANVDDSSCDYLSCAGCMDQAACNYDSSSTVEDGSCVYPEQYYDCIGNCLIDIDNDGVCDELEILGCTDQGACNYDSTANIDDDGSCEYETCAGCQYEFACNYDPEATIADNESCEFGTCPGCTDSTACNYNPTVSEDDGSCLYNIDAIGICGGDCSLDSNNDGVCDWICPEDLNSDGYITIQDLLLILSEFGCMSLCENDTNQDGSVSVVDLLLVLSGFGNTCDQIQNIPYVPVNFGINLNLPAYNSLNFPGQHLLLIGGSQGIIIFRYTMDEFVVLDRHSTFDIDLNCIVSVESDGITLSDDADCSESKWLIIDGSVMQGPATLPLHRYYTNWNPPILQVYN